MKKTSRTPLTDPPEQVLQLSRRLQEAMGLAPDTRLMGKKDVAVRLWDLPVAPTPPPTKSDSVGSLIDLDLADPAKPLPPGYFDKKPWPRLVHVPTGNAAPARPSIHRHVKGGPPADQSIAPHRRTDSASEPQKTTIDIVDLTGRSLLLPHATVPPSPLPSHTTPLFSSRPRPRHPIFWSTTLSTTVNAWLKHPETRATQTPLQQLTLLARPQPRPTTNTTTNDSDPAVPQPASQPPAPAFRSVHTFAAPQNPTMKLTHLVLPAAAAAAAVPAPSSTADPPLEWLVLTVTHDGTDPDKIFDLGCPDLTSSPSSSEDDFVEPPINVAEEGAPWLVLAVPAQQVTQREGKRWLLGMPERVPIVQGFGVEVKGKALRLWVEACARGMAGWEVVGEGGMEVRV